MENLIIIIILVAIVGGSSYYIYKAKKRGDACIGCPYSKTCKSHSCNGSCKDNLENINTH